MRRLEKLLLSKVEVWIVVLLLTLMTAGTVMFGALVKSGAQRSALSLLNVSSLSRVAVSVAEIPKTLVSLLHPNLCTIMTNPQRFDGEVGLSIADAKDFSGGGGGDTPS